MTRQVRNLNLNACEHLVRIHKVAFGSREGMVKMCGDVSFADSNVLISDHSYWQVEMCRLDSILGIQRGRIGLIKIDVEGYETEVIAGGRDTILRDRPVVLAEFNRERMAINRFHIEPTWSFFANAGYRFFVSESGSQRQMEYPEKWENIFLIPEELCHTLGS